MKKKCLLCYCPGSLKSGSWGSLKSGSWGNWGRFGNGEYGLLSGPGANKGGGILSTGDVVAGLGVNVVVKFKICPSLLTVNLRSSPTFLWISK